MSKKTSGLFKRGEIWHIDKRVCGIRIRESCETSEIEEAERYLNHRIHEIRNQVIYNQRKEWTFLDAATKYVQEETKKSLDRDIVSIEAANPFIGQLPLRHVHMGTLEKFINARLKSGIKAITVNRDLAIIRRILVLAARLWRDENGNTWLNEAPLIRMLKSDSRKPYPISWEEQKILLAELPDHLATMVLFALNTGLREKELTGLRWAEESRLVYTFILPTYRTKTSHERIVPLNSIARNIVEAQRGKNEDYIFTYKKHPIRRINGHAWRKARIRANLGMVRVHDLRHTFGRRLRANNVSFEDRQDLLGHKSSRITTHYSAPEIENLRACVELLCGVDRHNRIKTSLRFESVR